MQIKTLGLVLALSVAGGVNAQTEVNSDKFKVETNRFWNNWFVSAGGGAQVYVGDGDSKGDFGKRIAPALDIAVGKWFTPVMGLRLQYSGLQVKGFSTVDGAYADGKNSEGYYKQKWNVAHLHGDILLNASNLFFGYNEKRIYNLVPFVGMGVMHSWTSPKNNELAATVGIINRFRLNSCLDLNLEAKGTLVNDRFDGEIGGNGKEGLASVTVGLTYKFKQRGWNRATVISTGITEAEMNSVRDQLNSALRDNENLKNELSAARNNTNKVVEKEVIGSSRIVTFAIGKSKINKLGLVNLEMFAKSVKAGPADKVYTIVGYADSKTGSAKYNQKLSEARAEAVRDALVNQFGVNPSQLKVESKGGVANMFYNDAALNRAVIVD